MSLDGLFAVPANVVVFPVEELPALVRRQLTDDRARYAITILGSRRNTKVLDADTAQLLGQFKEPSSLVDGVIRFSDALEMDPREVLESAYPVLAKLISEQLLVRAGSPPASAVRVMAKPGDLIGRFTIVRTVQALEDVVVYQAESQNGTKVALKVADGVNRSAARASFEREAAVLTHLKGVEFPRLVQASLLEATPFLAVEWIDGVVCTALAESVRRPWAQGDLDSLLRSAVAVVEAYAALHAQGVVHGDVHPKNVLMPGPMSARILDFGYASIQGDSHPRPVPRAAVLTFYEPEWAKATLAARKPPPATQLSDQYSLAALLYLMFAGKQYLVPGREFRETLQQIADQPPLPFDVHGMRCWPALEDVLRRALAKNPAERYPAVTDMLEALRGLFRRTTARQHSNGQSYSPAQLLVSTALRLSRRDGLIDRGLPIPPLVSVNYGAAGIAYFFCRMAQMRERPGDLQTAMRWLDAAHRELGNPGAYVNPDIGLIAKRVGVVSPYHSVTGVHCVQALVANAMGDMTAAQTAISAFVAASQRACTSYDLTVGRSSTLVAAALLVEALRDTQIAQRSGLIRLGTETLGGIWKRVESQDLHNLQIRYWGVAHGWAGILFATLRWCEATGSAVPSGALDRLSELAAAAVRQPHGARWMGPNDPSMPASWCHGSTGYVHLWLSAADILAEDQFSRCGLDAAMHSWSSKSVNATLCCGQAGQAYAMLRAYQHTGETAWLRRARDLAQNAIGAVGTSSCFTNSLYKGDVGIALLACDLMRPELASMPLFASERWPKPKPRKTPAISETPNVAR